MDVLKQTSLMTSGIQWLNVHAYKPAGSRIWFAAQLDAGPEK